MPDDFLADVPALGWHHEGDWSAPLRAFWDNEEGRRLLRFLVSRVEAGALIYPPQPLRMLTLTPLASVRVVILGQDPYHGPGQAEGLAFSVPRGRAVPPSLRNIHTELERDLGLQSPGHGSLLTWARRGVLLLNTCLTVEDGKPASHGGRGWEGLTKLLLQAVAQRPTPCVYLLWGQSAQRWAGDIAGQAQISGQPALILKANHPSPLSARRGPVPFIGCGHFSRAADWLASQGVPWHWSLGPTGTDTVIGS
jgi:uracil-DNA glycosylase